MSDADLEVVAMLLVAVISPIIFSGSACVGFLIAERVHNWIKARKRKAQWKEEQRRFKR